MRVLIVIALIVGTTIVAALVLVGLVRDVLGHSYQAPPDLDNSDEWDSAADASADVAQPEVSYTERRAVGRYSSTVRRVDNCPGGSNALDDFHSAL
jgi:hypothetical protein